MATHSSILAWTIPWIEEPGGLQSIELQRVGHGWSDLALSMLCKHVPGGSGFNFLFLKLSGIKKTFFPLWFVVGWILRCGTCRFEGLNPYLCLYHAGLLLFWLNLDWYKLAVVSSPTQGMLLYDSWAKNVFYVFKFSSVQSLSHVWLFATPWIAARQASLSITNSRSSLRHPSSPWCHPAISSSVVPFFSCP